MQFDPFITFLNEKKQQQVNNVQHLQAKRDDLKQLLGLSMKRRDEKRRGGGEEEERRRGEEGRGVGGGVGEVEEWKWGERE